MYDYFAERLTRERHAEYVREVEHDELASPLHRRPPRTDGSSFSSRVHHWRVAVIKHLAPPHPPAVGHQH